MEPNDRVTLAEIKGDIKRIFDHFERYKDDALAASTRQTNFEANINGRLVGYSDRIRTLETANIRTAGEQAGTARAVKVAYIVGGGIATLVTGMFTALLRAWGVL